MSLYSIFYEHWNRNDRAALEPFLTRALADLLDRLTKDNCQLARRFVADVLLSPAARTSGKSADVCFGRLSRRLHLSDDLTWAPEETATLEKLKKRPDICLK